MDGVPLNSRGFGRVAGAAAHLLAGGSRTVANGSGAPDAFARAGRRPDQLQLFLVPGDLDQYLRHAHRLLRRAPRGLRGVHPDFFLRLDADGAFAADRFDGGPLGIPGGVRFPVGDATGGHCRPAGGHAMTVRAATAEDVPAIAVIQALSPEASQWDPASYLGYDCMVATTLPDGGGT